MKNPLLKIAAVVLCASPMLGQADVKLPAIFSDHMVLQKAAKVPIWGWAAPGEKITVMLSDQMANATADAKGKWMAELNLSNASYGPLQMTVQGNNTITISDVVIGEVWLASGQSNMELSLKETENGAAEIADSANPWLRVFHVTHCASPTPVDDCEGHWEIAGPETSGSFTAVGYYFAKAIQKELKVPVALIASHWGGTPSEAWTSNDVVKTLPNVAEKQAEQLKLVSDFPAKFLTETEAWIKTNAREDHPPTEVAAFAGDDLTAKTWIPVKLPGGAAVSGLPQNGAFWLRKDLTLKAGQSFSFTLTFSSAYASVYWNGKLIKDYALGDLAEPQKYTIPAAEVKEGRNVLALRLYTPFEPGTNVTFDGANAAELAGDWQASAEYEFPAATIDLKTLPKRAPAASPAFIAGNLFNGMINPLIPYAIKGVIWYQGEANAGRGYSYRTAFPAMINDWRARWKQGDFPFYFCQLPNFLERQPQPADGQWAELRDAQNRTLKLPNTGEAVLIGLGGTWNIHPINKQPVGERLSRIALGRDYGREVVYSGPTYESMKVEGDKIRVTLGNLGGGLVAQPVPATAIVQPGQEEPLTRNSPNSELEGFAICGDDHHWVWADAKIDGKDVVVWSSQVPKPVAVRYAWANNPIFNLYNAAGLPAAPFRTDDFPPMTLDVKYPD